MNTKTEKEQVKEMFEKVMDNRDDFFKSLYGFEAKHGFIPEQYGKDVKLMASFAEYKTQGPWRKSKIARLLIDMAVKKAMKAGGIKNLKNENAVINALKNVGNAKKKSQRVKTGRNDLCPCGSGKKYKHCCL